MQQVDDEGPENYKVELIDSQTEQIVSQKPEKKAQPSQRAGRFNRGTGGVDEQIQMANLN